MAPPHLPAGRSYRTLGLVTERQIDSQNRMQLLRNFVSRGEEIEVDEDWTTVDRVLDMEKSRNKVWTSCGGSGACKMLCCLYRLIDFNHL